LSHSSNSSSLWEKSAIESSILLFLRPSAAMAPIGKNTVKAIFCERKAGAPGAKFAPMLLL
jgi:hypothetical protein